MKDLPSGRIAGFSIIGFSVVCADVVSAEVDVSVDAGVDVVSVFAGTVVDGGVTVDAMDEVVSAPEVLVASPPLVPHDMRAATEQSRSAIRISDNIFFMLSP